MPVGRVALPGKSDPPMVARPGPRAESASPGSLHPALNKSKHAPFRPPRIRGRRNHDQCFYYPVSSSRRTTRRAKNSSVTSQSATVSRMRCHVFKCWWIPIRTTMPGGSGANSARSTARKSSKRSTSAEAAAKFIENPCSWLARLDQGLEKSGPADSATLACEPCEPTGRLAQRVLRCASSLRGRHSRW